MIRSIFNRFSRFKFQRNTLIHFSWKSPVYFPVCRFSIIEEGSDATKLLEEVEGKVLQTIKSFSKREMDKINRTATFEELGFDSLDAVDLIVTIEETLRIDIEDEEAARLKTPNDAIALFHRYVLERYNKNKLARRKQQRGLVIKEEKEQEIMQ